MIYFSRNYTKLYVAYYWRDYCVITVLSLLHPCTPCTLVEINEVKCIRQGAHKSNRISSSLCSHNKGLSLKYIYMNMSVKGYLCTYVVYHITCMLGDNKDIVNCELLWDIGEVSYSLLTFLYPGLLSFNTVFRSQWPGDFCCWRHDPFRGCCHKLLARDGDVSMGTDAILKPPL